MSERVDIADLKTHSRPPARPTGMIFDIKKYAIHDGPGIRTTVFFKGCPLACRWCHNPESWKDETELAVRSGRCLRCGRCVERCPSGAVSLAGSGPLTDPDACTLCGECVDACLASARELIGRRVSVSEVMTEIVKDLVFYEQSGGGATFSGGEPLRQPEFLLALLEACRRQEIHTAVDTTCHAEPDVVEEVARNTDLFLCDLKHMDPEKHRNFTGVDNRLILENIKRLAVLGARVVLRIPIVPGFNDDDDAIDASAEFAASLPNVEHIDILPYNSGGNSKALRLAGPFGQMQTSAPTAGKMAEIAARLRACGLNVKTGG